MDYMLSFFILNAQKLNNQFATTVFGTIVVMNTEKNRIGIFVLLVYWYPADNLMGIFQKKYFDPILSVSTWLRFHNKITGVCEVNTQQNFLQFSCV